MNSGVFLPSVAIFEVMSRPRRRDPEVDIVQYSCAMIQCAEFQFATHQNDMLCRRRAIAKMSLAHVGTGVSSRGGRPESAEHSGTSKLDKHSAPPAPSQPALLVLAALPNSLGHLCADICADKRPDSDPASTACLELFSKHGEEKLNNATNQHSPREFFFPGGLQV